MGVTLPERVACRLRGPVSFAFAGVGHVESGPSPPPEIALDPVVATLSDPMAEIARLRAEMQVLTETIAVLRRDLTAIAAIAMEVQQAQQTRQGAPKERPTRCSSCGGALKYHQAEAGYLVLCGACGSQRFLKD